MKHLIVINPKSFFQEEAMHTVIKNISAYFESTAKSDYEIYMSRYPRDAISVINEYAVTANDAVRVYAVGGDGILYDCLNGLVNLPNVDLAVIPYGTSNDFMRSFGENKRSIFRDISKQATADSIPTDIISIGGRYALNFCSIGSEAAVIFKYYEISKNHPFLLRIFGKHLYMAGIPSVFQNKRISRQKYEVLIDGEKFDGNYVGINVGNGSCYGGNKTPFPMAHPADGQLDIMLFENNFIVSLRMYFIANDYLKGKSYKHPNVLRHMNAKEIVVRSDSPIYLNVDGESYYDSKVEAKIVPSAVRIVAPDGLKFVRRLEL